MSPKRRAVRSVLIVTNGEITERSYLNHLKALVRHDRSVHVRVQHIQGDPGQVMRKLKSPHGDASDYDEVWIVVDEDGEDREAFLAECRRMCSRSQLWVGVVTRPCFEVWLTAHYAHVSHVVTQDQAQRSYERIAGVERESRKELPASFPLDQYREAVLRCTLPGIEHEQLNEMPPLPGSGMPHLLRSLGLV